jgi:hypothetical protein
MTENRQARSLMAWLALAAAGLLLQACTENRAAPSAPTARVFAADMAGGAKSCEASKPDLTDGQSASATMKVGNDGGWCGIAVAQKDGKPFQSGLLVARSTHGKVLIHQVGDSTRIDYTPDRGFTGSDSFAVKLIPGDAVLRVAVTVTAP